MLPRCFQVLLDIGYSLQYLHKMNLLHGDIKVDNVLLKSEPSRPLGFTPKVMHMYCIYTDLYMSLYMICYICVIICIKIAPML